MQGAANVNRIIEIVFLYKQEDNHQLPALYSYLREDGKMKTCTIVYKHTCGMYVCDLRGLKSY